MIKLSDSDIDEILHSIDVAYKINIGIRKRDQLIIFMKDWMRMVLKNKQCGLKENVCNKCLGTGYSQIESEKI